MGPRFATTARLARKQHGRVARRQLLEAGVDGEQIKRWIADGRLWPVHALPEITVPTTAGRRRPGIVVHRVRRLHGLDVATLDGVPITTAPRVLLDLAPRVPSRVLTRLCHEAWVRHRTGPRHVEACIARNPGKKGAARLRHALGAEADVARRRRSNHLAFTYGDVFERGVATAAELARRLAAADPTAA